MMHATDEIARMMAMDAAAHGGSADLSNYYTKSETDAHIADKVAEIVADAPEDFDTLKEMSDWIASHEDSAAAMNSAILQNAADIEAVETQQTEQAKSISAAAEGVAMNRSTLGYQSKNLLSHKGVSKTVGRITYTANEDGSVTANGTATENSTYVVAYVSDIKSKEEANGKNVILSGCPAGGSSKYRLQFYKGAGNPTAVYDYGSGVEIPFDLSVFASNANVAIVILNGNTVNSLTFYPMLRYADITDDTYEPYKPSVQEQIDGITDQIFGLGTNIPSGADLNSYKTAGVYFSENEAKSMTLLNCPHKTSGFRLEVKNSITLKHTMHLLYPNTQDGYFYMRFNTASVNGSWYKHQGTAVTT